MDFVTRPEFEEHKNHMDSRFNTLEDNIKEVKQELTTTKLELKTDIKDLKDDLISLFDEKEKANKEEMKHTQIKWYIATTLIIVGVVGRILGFY
ncbi:hypothetical protein [Mammaliicoccus sciuri]|uniref:hypothetical protein n=1 Tax=Mammaliicoccus sciuri TaxID=1296 RepID=UPI0020A14491|nr:hypothetical protein [Mammaliicoccus sciuri]MCP1286792.1 hypothetical protein [Mammaliicoccus sciuri]MDO0955974.1 hypothetical protein [Mammaliicoccus sciuri]